MSPRRGRAGPEKVAELKALYERGWLGQHCSNVLAERAGIHREEGQSGEDALVAFRQKRLERRRQLNQNQLAPYPGRGSQCDVVIDPSTIVANPPGTPIEAPPAMRPDSPAFRVPLTDSRPRWKDEITETPPPPPPPPPPAHGPHSTSLRGRVETLLGNWEQERCRDLAAASDTTLLEPIREAARRAAEIGGIYIEELDRMYHEYVRDIAS